MSTVEQHLYNIEIELDLLNSEHRILQPDEFTAVNDIRLSVYEMRELTEKIRAATHNLRDIYNRNEIEGRHNINGS